jgi:hypothetical protein
MRFFTYEWWLSAQRPARRSREVSSPSVAYQKHFESIRESLPPSVSQLTDNETLHDATVMTFEIDTAASALSIKLRGWNPQFRNARLFTLSYENVRTVSMFAASDGPLPGPPGVGDLGYWEFDVHSPGVFSHCMLFSTGIELAVFFSRFGYTASRASIKRRRVRLP